MPRTEQACSVRSRAVGGLRKRDEPFFALGFRLLFERGIQVSVCGDLLDVFLKKSFSSQSLVLGYVNEFVCKQPKISRAIQANNDAVTRRQTPGVGIEQANLSR